MNIILRPENARERQSALLEASEIAEQHHRKIGWTYGRENR